MKYLKLFENFSLEDLEQQYQDAKDLYELGLIDRTGLRYVEDQLKLERYIADGRKGCLDLARTGIQSLGKLTRVGGDLDLRYSSIQDLGELRKVGGYLDLEGTGIKSLGELREVRYLLNLRGTPISKTHTEEEIRARVQVGGKVYLSSEVPMYF